MAEPDRKVQTIFPPTMDELIYAQVQDNKTEIRETRKEINDTRKELFSVTQMTCTRKLITWL